MLFVLISSVLSALSMPGFLWGGLIWFSLIFLFKGLEKTKYWLVILYSFIYFYIFTFISLFWVIPILTKNLPEFFGRFNGIVGFGVYLLLCLIESLPFVLFGALYGYFVPRIKNKLASGIFVASIYTISEYIRSIGELGFTGNRLSDALFKDTGLIQSVSFFGTIGLTFFIVLINFLLYTNLTRLNKFIISIVSTMSVIYLINAIIVSILPINNANIPIVAVQTNYDQNVKISISSKEVLKDLQKILKSTPNYLHIFPEATFPSEDIRFTEIENYIKEVSYEKPIIIGFPTYNSNVKNSALVYFNGKNIGEYNKIKLFPFVEFLPYENIFKLFTFLKGVSYFSPGKEYNVFTIENYPKFGIQICFESYFGEISRNITRNGAEMLFVITNDGWYDYNTALWQHFSKSIFRAIENRRYIVQVSNKGITGLVDKYGRIIQIIPPRTEEFSIFNIKGENQTTLYNKFGDWFIFLALIFSISIPIFFKNNRRNYFH
ncbi:MAG: apolipoprotein N-acyltransferase [Thermosipho sp. (in: Bacteria)]|nr:apolipoprotein N-acyltransferase [Thermosipho sp. (in: thermotogales)]